jgi:hypothetical protein
VSRLRSVVVAVWDFVVGDDWATALGVVLALGATALIADSTSTAWVVMPVAVLGLLVSSLRRAR